MTEALQLRKTRAEWANVSGKHLAEYGSWSQVWFLIEDAQLDIEALHRHLERQAQRDERLEGMLRDIQEWLELAPAENKGAAEWVTRITALLAGGKNAHCTCPEPCPYPSDHLPDDCRQRAPKPDFCDGNCTWLDHHPDCNRSVDQPEEAPHG